MSEQALRVSKKARRAADAAAVDLAHYNLHLGSIEAACKLIGGTTPIAKSTYYRGVAHGLYPAPTKVAPNISRVDLDKLAVMLRGRVDQSAAA